MCLYVHVRACTRICVCVYICVCARTRVRTCKRDYVFMEGDGEIDKRQEWRGVVREMSREGGVATEKRQNLYITNCFQAARRERWTKMPVELTLRRIMKGEVTICLLLLVLR